FQQLAQSEAVDAGVVGDHRQVSCARIPQGSDQRLRNATQAESADGKGLAMAYEVAKRGRRIGKPLAPAWLRAGRRHPRRPVAEDAGILTGALRRPIGRRDRSPASPTRCPGVGSCFEIAATYAPRADVREPAHGAQPDIFPAAYRCLSHPARPVPPDAARTGRTRPPAPVVPAPAGIPGTRGTPRPPAHRLGP